MLIEPLYIIIIIGCGISLQMGGGGYSPQALPPLPYIFYERT